MNRFLGFIFGYDKCYKCGQQLDEHSDFCPNCGEEVGIFQKNGDYWYFGRSHIKLSLIIIALIYALFKFIINFLKNINAGL